MRHLINIVEAASLPDYVYHGTNLRLWNDDLPRTEPLCLTIDKKDAENYAEESYISAHDHEDPLFFDAEIAPIIVRFKFSDLMSLDLEFHPDFGWDGVTDVTTWKQSLDAIGSFCVTGVTPANKKIGKVILL